MKSFPKIFLITLASCICGTAVAATKSTIGNQSTAQERADAKGTLDFDKDIDWAFGVKTGLAKFQTNFTEGVTESIGLKIHDNDSVSNVITELIWYNKKNLAANLGYRLVMGAGESRATYQASYAGLLYYPWGLGVPIVSRRSYNTIRYTPKVKPYAYAGASVGHAIIATFLDAATDVSSEFLGINGGGGLQYHSDPQTSFEISAVYERAVGFSTAVDYVGNNLFVLFGLHIYY
jgi:hypothetical protein